MDLKCKYLTLKERKVILVTSLKTNELLRKIKEHLQKGTYIVSAHALERQNLRLIDLEDVLHVLKTGFREESKDLFDVKRQAWRYAIRGRTIESINIRVIISFEDEMVIITVMRVK